MSNKDIWTTIQEDWVERDDGIYYRWKLIDEKEWHYKKTAYKEKPFVQLKYLSPAELKELYKGVAMTNQEILEKAIQKAINGGWHHYGGDNPDIIVETATYPITMSPEYRILIGPRPYSYASHSKVIFNHDFAKALWGKQPISDTPPVKIRLPKWQYHLQQMVIAEDPLKYLSENI